jgi:hypothetical protein
VTGAAPCGDAGCTGGCSICSRAFDVLVDIALRQERELQRLREQLRLVRPPLPCRPAGGQ